MATLDDIQTAVDNTGDKAQDAADRVIASIGAAQDTIEDLTAQVEALKNAGTLDPEKVDRILEGLSKVDSILEGIEPGEGETNPGDQPHPDQTLPGDLPS